MNGIKIEITGNFTDKNALLNVLREEVNPRFEKAEVDSHVFLSQHYSLLNNSELMIAIFVKFNSDKTSIEIIAGGGGEGIFGYTSGSEKGFKNDVYKKVKQFCNKNMFQINSAEIDLQ